MLYTEITRDYWGLLGRWPRYIERLLEITRDYWGLLGIAGDYWVGGHAVYRDY